MGKILTRVAYNDDGRRVGATHHRARLTEEQIDFILEKSDEGMGYRRIAALFPVTAPDPDTGRDRPCWHPAWTTVRDVIKGNTRCQTIAKWRWITTGEVG